MVVLFLFAPHGVGQSAPYERTFPLSKTTVEKAVRELQSSSAGHLPVLDGFIIPGDRALDRFQRGYYQCTVQVTSTSSGGSLVQVNARITAWYVDPVAAKSGYQVLPSNGRIESDFLDRLEQTLGGKTSSASSAAAGSPVLKPKDKVDASAPGVSPFQLGAPTGKDELSSVATRKAVTDRHMEELAKEAKNLAEILRNQSHPDNLIAVKKSGTPIFADPSEGARVLFLATAEDEFEILDMNANWVHIRISGLSRGWIRRTSVEGPEASLSAPEAELTAGVSQAPSQPAAKPPFQVANEQIASFPGDWEPLRGKTVRIISLQKTGTTTGDTGPRAKLEFARSLFDREYAELTRSPATAAGVVLVFDSEDGGMVATTLTVLQQWKAGTLSDEDLWRRCYLDPAEMFSVSTHP